MRRTAAELDELRVNSRVFRVRIETPHREDGSSIDRGAYSVVQNNPDSQPWESVGEAIANALDGVLIGFPLMALAEAAGRVSDDDAPDSVMAEAVAFRDAAQRLIARWNE